MRLAMPRFITNPRNLAVLKLKFLNLKDIPKKKVKSILGEPEKVSTDLASESKALEEKELENLKRLVQEQKISTEQARAFLAGAVDISQASRLQNKYILYSYKMNRFLLSSHRKASYFMSLLTLTTSTSNNVHNKSLGFIILPVD